MEIIVLGSGVGIPSLTRNAPGYHLSLAGREALVDCGPGTLLQLLRAGRHCRELDAVFLTHVHPDHVADLVYLIHALKLLTDPPRAKPLHVVGPEGFAAFFQQAVAFVAPPSEAFAVIVEERGTGGGFPATSAPTVHTPRMASIAWRFEEAGRSVVFSGDCDLDPGLIAFARGADLLILDCSTTDAAKVPGHLSAGECGVVARAAGVGEVWLSHLYPTPGGDGQRLLEFRRECPAIPVRVAEDLMVKTLQGGHGRDE